MAQVALGAVGAVVGFYIGGPAGAGLGWSIGSAAGGVLFPPKGPHTEGPRLTDLKQQLSTYGAPKPLIFGRMGLAGNFIWTADVIEVATTEESGKGEPSTSSTTFTYFWSGAILIAKGPRDGSGYHALLRIWVNGKCFYDVRDPSNVEANIASANFASYFTWYPGTYTQDPDPTIEAALGVGNVPGYRGRSYIVFNDLPLSLFNNYPPGALNFMFEIQRKGPTDVGITLIADAYPMTGSWMFPVQNGTIRNDLDLTAAVSVYTVQGDHIINEAKTDEEAAYPVLWNGGGDKAVALMYDGSTVRGQILGTTAFSDPLTVLYAEETGIGGTQNNAKPLFSPSLHCRAIVPCADRRHILVITAVVAGVTDGWTLLEWDSASGWSIADSGTATGEDCNHFGAIGPSSQGELYYAAMMESNLRYSWSMAATGGGQVQLCWIDDSGNMSRLEIYNKIPSDPSGFSLAMMWADAGLCYTVSGGYYNLFTRLDALGDNTQVLSEVHSEICEQGGLTPSQLEVSQLTDIVDGFRVVPVGAARAFLNHLERCYWYDTVETGGQIKAVKRGQTSVVTIPQDDLAASYDVDMGDSVVSERADEDSLPAEINVAYLVETADYQVGVQLAQREATYTQQPDTVELPLVLTDLKAKEVGEVLLYDAWLSRTRRSFKTSRKYSYLEPTDVVTLELDDATYVVRIIAMRVNGGVLEFDAVDEDDAIYEPNSVAGAIIDPNPGLTITGPTMVALMDLPALRSEDSDSGFYMAAAGYLSGWPGMQLYASTDGGANYSVISATSTAATMGFVATALGNHTGGNFYDVKNQITVELRSGSLTSITDAQLYAGGNAFALGNEAVGYEVIQFKTATLSSGTTYVLSQLLRGRKGTERLMATHVANEKFVLLTVSGLTRIPMEIASLNSARLYRPVTFLQQLSDASIVTFTNTGAALKPYSPVHVRALRESSGDITIYWIRRGRLNNEWNNGIDVPLSEDSESYEIDVYIGAVLTRAMTSTTQTKTYTLAQQTTDFGSPLPSSLDLRIRQQSADVGDGFDFTGTVTVIG